MNDIVTVHTVMFCISAGRVQVTTPADREEEARQNQRMYWATEGFITRTSEAIGERRLWKVLVL